MHHCWQPGMLRDAYLILGLSAGGGGEHGRIMKGLLTASLPEPCSSSVLLSELWQEEWGGII